MLVKRRQEHLSLMPWRKQQDCCFLWRWTCRRPHLPKPSQQRCSAVQQGSLITACSEVVYAVLSNSKIQPHKQYQITRRVQNPDIPQPGRDGAALGGTAGRGRGGDGAGRDADRSIRAEDNRPSYLPRRLKNTLLGVFLEARTKETLCKPMEQNKRLTTVFSAFYPRDDGRSSFLVADQYTVA